MKREGSFKFDIRGVHQGADPGSMQYIFNIDVLEIILNSSLFLYIMFCIMF